MQLIIHGSAAMTLIEHACPCWPFSRNVRYKWDDDVFGSGSAVVDVDDNNNSNDGQVMSLREITKV